VWPGVRGGLDRPGLPVAEVAPHWLPSLVADEQGGVAVVTVHDPEGATESDHEGDEGLQVSGAWGDLTQLDLAPEGASDWRLERPVLGTDGDAIVLAAVAHTAEEMHRVRARSTDDDASWETLPEPVLSSQVLPPVTPVQGGDQTWIAALGDLALSHARVEVLVDTGVGAWQRLTLLR
jgi:hypothetical protein